MKIGIISDSHDNKKNILKAIEILNAEKVEKVFHAGDIVSVNSADLFRDLDAELVITFGNCDVDRDDLRVVLHGKAEIHEEFYHGVLAGKKIFMSHKPEYMHKKNEVDVMIYGHTHRAKVEKYDNCVVLNPGEVVGRRTGRATIMIYDLEKNEDNFRILEL